MFCLTLTTACLGLRGMSPEDVPAFVLHPTVHIPSYCTLAQQDDFKITKKIATGGFGTVYRAELDDGKTPGGRPVIIKKVSLPTLPKLLRTTFLSF